MNSGDGYGSFMLDITLNRNGYNCADADLLFEEPFSTLYRTRVGYTWLPSAVGLDLIEIRLVFSFVLTGVATTLVAKITSDLYNWAKKSLSRVLNRKKSFSESSIVLVFDDVTIRLYVHEREHILMVMENLGKVIDYFKNEAVVQATHELDFEGLRTVLGNQEDD